MMIGMLKLDNEYFVLKNIEEPLEQGWRMSDCGQVAISLTKHYYCDGVRIIESPVDMSSGVNYQLFGKVADVYVYFNEIAIFGGDLHHTFHFGLKSFKTISPDMMVRIINNLNVAGVSL